MTTPAVRPPRDVLRSRADGALVAAGAVLLVPAALPVERDRVGVVETAAFRAARSRWW